MQNWPQLALQSQTMHEDNAQMTKNNLAPTKTFPIIIATRIPIHASWKCGGIKDIHDAGGGPQDGVAVGLPGWVKGENVALLSASVGAPIAIDIGLNSPLLASNAA